MTVALRRTTTADPAFARLIAALDRDLRDRYGALQDTYDPLNRVDLDTAIVAADGDLPVGCGCFKRFDDATVEIKRVFVVADRRGRGVAGAILGGLEAWARELGYAHAVLELGRRQPEAAALYRRHGYVETEAFEPYVGMAESLCLRKALAPA